MDTKWLPGWAIGILIIIFIITAIVVIIGLVLLQEGATNEQPISSTSIGQRPIRSTVEVLPTITPSPSANPSASPTASPSPSPTLTASPSTTSEAATPSPAPSLVAQETSEDAANDCPPPEGWEAYTVQQGDTLFAFQLGANRAGNPASVDEILAANCLNSSFLAVNQFLYLPPGAAENAPSSEPVAPDLPSGVSRDANCPCTITIQPGWRIEQIADAINRTSVAFSGADFLAVAGSGSSLPDRDFLAGVPAGAGLEGFMLPGSYTLEDDTSAIGFRDMVLDAFAANAAGLMNSIAAQGISPYEGLIMASIIQKESGNPAEQPIVASVFYNRRAAGKALGATVTIQYALGVPGNWWPRLQSGQTSLDSPYNTYRFLGFPPTPISSPSLSAIQAVAAPAQTNYQYFTGNCNGPGNVFAATYEEHLANVNCN